MTVIEFIEGDTIAFRTAHTNVQLDLERDVRECAIGNKGSRSLLLWALIAATREQTKAIREFTALAKQQAEDIKNRTEHITPENLLGMVTEQMPELLKILNAAGVSSGGDTGSRTIVPGANGS